MIIAISDVHLGWKDEGKQDIFLEFLNRCDTDKIDHFVLLGDIFDFWARSNINIFSSKRPDEKIQTIVDKNVKILKKLSSLKVKNTHYVVGNHDYLIHTLHKRNPEHYPFPIYKNLRLSDGGTDFFFTHGYDLDVLATMELYKMSIVSYEKSCYALSFLTDKTGGPLVNGWGLYEKIKMYKNALEYMIAYPKAKAEEYEAVRRLANSEALPIFLGIRDTDNLVFGHTHQAYYHERDDGRMIANTGCWSGTPEKEDGPVNTYVKIDDGEMGFFPFPW
jgi:UDP-2,3-diacylglucosamine pyrophosphatase LpxH